MQVFSTALAVNLKKTVLKPGESTKMKVTVMAQNLSRGKSTPRILMITNDPEHPSVTVLGEGKGNGSCGKEISCKGLPVAEADRAVPGYR